MLLLPEPAQPPKILILMAARNGGEWIREQIVSILAQENVVIELTISDDHSTDDTRAQINQFAGNGKVRMLSPPTSSGSAAQNFLWLMRNAPTSHHDYVALADQDDIWKPDKMHRACLALRKSRADGYSCAVTAFWSDGRERSLGQVTQTTRSDYLFEGAGQGCTFVLTAKFFSDLTCFFAAQPNCISDVHYHDWAIYAVARSWNRAWHFDPKSLMKYRQHPANDTGARLSLSGVKKRLVLIKRGWYRRQLLKIAEICAKAAPGNPTIDTWNKLLCKRPSFGRRLRVACFCVNGGRRRRSDRLILVICALLGWI